MKKCILSIALLLMSNGLWAENAPTTQPSPSVTPSTTTNATSAPAANTVDSLKQSIIDKSLVTSQPLSASPTSEEQGQATTVMKNLDQCTPGVYSFLSGTFDIKGSDKDDCLLIIKAPDETGEMAVHHCKLSKNTVNAYVESLTNFSKNTEQTEKTVLAENELEKALDKECD